MKEYVQRFFHLLDESMDIINSVISLDDYELVQTESGIQSSNKLMLKKPNDDKSYILMELTSKNVIKIQAGFDIMKDSKYKGISCEVALNSGDKFNLLITGYANYDGELREVTARLSDQDGFSFYGNDKLGFSICDKKFLKEEGIEPDVVISNEELRNLLGDEMFNNLKVKFLTSRIMFEQLCNKKSYEAMKNDKVNVLEGDSLMINKALKEKLFLSDKVIEDLNTILYFDGYVVDENMSTPSTVVLTSKEDFLGGDSIVRISLGSDKHSVVAFSKGFVYGNDEEAMSSSTLIIKKDMISLIMQYDAKGKTIMGSFLDGIYSYSGVTYCDEEDMREVAENDMVVATLLSKVKFLTSAKAELPIMQNKQSEIDEQFKF